MSSEDAKDVEKRFANRRSEIFKMLGEICKEKEYDFADRLRLRLEEFEQRTDNAIKLNDPLNAATHQFLTDYFYSYMKTKANQINLAQYRTFADEQKNHLACRFEDGNDPTPPSLAGLLNFHSLN